MAAPKVRKFAGDIRLWRKATDGTLTPVIPEALDPERNQPVETNAFSFSYEAGEDTTINSKRRGARYNQPIFADQQPGTTSVSLTLLEVPTAILARVLYGEAANASIATGTATDVEVTVERLDGPIQLPHRYIKASPALTLEAGATPLVLGTDYLVDLRKGTVVILSAGTVGATVDVGDTLTASYQYEGVTATSILGGATPVESFYITGDLEDRISDEQGYLQVYEARLTVDGEVDWLSAEPLSPVLTGILLVPDGAPAPYKFDVYQQTA